MRASTESTPLVPERRPRALASIRAVPIALAAIAALALAFAARDGARAFSFARANEPPSYVRGASLAGELSAASEATVRAYGRKDAHVLRWTHETGFRFARADARLYTRSGLAQAEVKMRLATELAAKTIETYYPERLKADQPPFEVLYVVTDYPQTACVAAAAKTADPTCADAERWSPIYMLGSAPRDEKVLPTLVGATLITLATRVMEAMGRPTVERRSDSPVSWAQQNLEFDLFDLATVHEAERASYEWENLKNVIVWRGGDYPFLGPAFPNFKEEACRPRVRPCRLLHRLASYDNKTVGFSDMLGRNDITPRLRAVLMSKLDGSWIDAAFIAASPGLDRELGIETDTPMSTNQHAQYKYQFDLGGWGGTTWTGTLRKLSMPGVLFHHETSMKDSFSDALEPWKHYIPVKEDLSDLRERYDWARAHDEECRRISETATAWVRDFTSRRSILEHNYLKLAVPLERALDPTGAHRIPFQDAHPEFKT